ncbi:tol-Pal system protein TolA-like [Helianthus annuus]|uniref:tol-Pal system protein TolA-like n=1 Tax=Helianthus annuus TaxID=4232 RepID=UPI000B9040BA|nr:tol-Pal system protein TolA-like [Helianthus annuus]
MANAIMEDYKVLGRKEEENARLRAEAEALAKAAREGAEQLEREKAAFEQYKQTEEWAELMNVKAANAALVKEKAATDVVAKEAKEAEARAAKAEVQNRVTILAEVTARAAEAEARAREATEARDSLVSSFDQFKIVGAIRDAPENAAAVEELKQRAREAGFKAGYNRCISHMNLLSQGKFTDERSGFHGVDTEARLVVAVAAYNDLSISALEEVDKCLEAEDYVDRLRSLYGDPQEEEEEETAGNGTGGAGTSGTKKD